MQIRKIDTTRRADVRTFIGLPFRLYERNRQWVPPLLPAIRASLDRRKSPFYLHSDADFFVIENVGDVLGRIAVMENRNHNRHHGRRDAFFHLFESIDDHEVAELYGAWGEKKRSGKTSMGIIRSHFAVDEEGKLVEFKLQVKPETTADLALRLIKL